MSESTEHAGDLESPFHFPDHVPYEPSHDRRPLPGISPAGSMVPRYIAACVDNLLAIVLAVVIAKLLPERWIVVQVVVVIVVYLGYYFVSEALTSMTPAKYFAGVKVCAFDGGRCTARQILIRTLFRIIDVNPICGIGGIFVVLSPSRQRLGDWVAGTIVVLSSRTSR